MTVMKYSFYALYDPATNLYLAGMPNVMYHGREDRKWNPLWTPNPSPCVDLDRAIREWNTYEFQRLKYRPRLPVCILGEFDRSRDRRAWHCQDMPLTLTPMAALILLVNGRHGHVLATAMKRLPGDRLPIYAIKRTGNTKRVINDLPEGVIGVGMYLFFWEPEDIFLAKIALGPNYKYTYDLAQYHSDLPQ